MNQIQFTDAAAQHIKTMLDKSPDSIGFRLSIKKTGCSGFAYVPELIEKVNEKDLHFTAQENLRVYVDKEVLIFIDTITVDYVVDEIQGLKQKRLVFINPKEAGRCGCGESFTI